ncbi:MAG TPA: hypothetical protein PKY05_19740, partial [Fibrobacteria bacterium]|nr:hypothetical protein [Fibrobacteria bacterium]
MKTAFFALALCSAISAAPFSFSGKIVDEAGAPIPGAVVSLDGATGSATTTTQGEFSMVGEGGVSVRPSGRVTGLRVSLFSNTVEWAGAGPGASLDVFRLNGTLVGRDIPFVEGRATLPPHAGMALLMRVKSQGKVVAELQGAGTAALRQAAVLGALRVSKAGYA